MMSEFQTDKIRADFPNLDVKMNGKPLVYLDSAATSQRPMQVLNAADEYYTKYNANVHRGIYKIAERATEEYTNSKIKTAKFINGGSMNEIIYVRNATEAINLVSLSWGESNVKKGDHILISEMEHHSNIVPWMILAKKKGAILDYIALDKTNSTLDFESLGAMLEKRPKIVAVTHTSNVLGTINDVKEITRKAHKAGAAVLIDAAQSVPHMKVDVKDIGADFVAFSGHKMLGPTGIGVLYAKREILDSMNPLFGGGDMIKSVQYDSWTPNDPPWKFEAGTPNISGGIGLGAAVDYLEKLGMKSVREHDKRIALYAIRKLSEVKGVKIYGLGEKDIDRRGGVISFNVGNVHPHDVAQILDSEGVAIRAGHHCAMPLVTQKFGVPAVSRMSFYIYNKESEIDTAVRAIEKVKKIFRVK